MRRTDEFQDCLKGFEKRVNASSKPPKARIKFGKARRPPLVPGGPPSEDSWTKQAEQVASNLRSFAGFLHSIRRAYLDLSSASAHHASAQPRSFDSSKGLSAWEGVRWLTDRERDEIDFGVKVALRRSVDRVRELETAEKRQSHSRASLLWKLTIDKIVKRVPERLAHEARRNPNAGLARMLGLPVPSVSKASESLTTHRTLITLYLNTLLANVSQLQRDQQETRVVRQLERNATLGGLGGGGALGMDEYGRSLAEKAKSDHMLGIGGSKGKDREADGTPAGEVPSIYRPKPIASDADDNDDDELDNLLTETQIQQFEAEESALLKSTQADLESLKLAESSLLEIAALQSQLAMHLAQQSELTDKLWEEAVGVTGKVEEGNVQLKKARERNRESRMWLLIFLMMSSFTLLFLDYYS